MASAISSAIGASQARGVGLVAVGLTGTADEDRPVLRVGCNARDGFDGDVGSDTDEHEGVDA
jgi:hypothetical protein